MDERLTRRGSLLQLGGLITAGVTGWKAETASAGPGGGRLGCDQLRPRTRADRRAVLRRRREGPAQHHRRAARHAADAPARVADASTCAPIKGAAVDIWHCDAGGVYSGLRQQTTVGKTFLRGVQRTDAKGIATFQTIYPGWYPGRTVHIHVKVHLGGNVVHTGQLYFADTVTDAAFRRPPYASRPGRDTRNADDSIFRNGGRNSLLATAQERRRLRRLDHDGCASLAGNRASRARRSSARIVIAS